MRKACVLANKALIYGEMMRCKRKQVIPKSKWKMQKTASKMAFLLFFEGFLEEKIGCLRLRFESKKIFAN